MMKKMTVKVGIVGCGVIGGEIAKACLTRFKGRVRLTAFADIDPDKARAIAKSLSVRIPVMTIGRLVGSVDLVIESASGTVVKEVVASCIRSRKDVLIMSVGGLIGNEDILSRAEKAGIKVYLPSGAVSGIDGLKAARIGKIKSVTLTTKKPVRGLLGAPYLKEHDMDLSEVKGETVVFYGSAKEAVKGFPQNINVSAVVSLAGIGAANTMVRIMTSPAYTKNVHELEVIGDAGRVMTVTENIPSRNNPRTSAMAFYSAIAAVEGILKGGRIGT